MTKPLSERQQKVFTFIKNYLEVNGYPPTVREIGKGVGIASTSLVSYYLRGLMEHGYISRGTAVSRAIRLTAEEEMGDTFLSEMPDTLPVAAMVDTLPVPFLGYIVASAPIPVEPLPGNETVEISRALFGRDADNLFALRVKGDSMIDALIGDGDTVILRHQERVENGEMAAVWLTNNAGETTLKKVYYENDMIRLQPANPTMGPIMVPARHVQVQGKVVMVLRRLN